uniref:Uncharacterized protein LOC111135394 isoform X1 n=3 Tax=Crassostrea virginica TaxID=6565 RepID=A0A8B8EMM2_CRAVI|nr:uncharacterized protein LOC111135394 isoform X1 [Crassostrea virginica]
MMFSLVWLCFYFLTEGYGLTNEKCWTIDDVRSKKDGFIRCPKNVIVVKDFKEFPALYCYHENKLKQLKKCNGLYNICDINDVDILTIMEEHVDSCFDYGKPSKVCIIYDCIPGPFNNMTDNTALTKVSGSLFQAVLLHGFVRCSIFGHITNITVAKAASQIWLRDENGTEIMFYSYRGRNCFHYWDWDWDSQMFSLTKAVKMNAIEVTILTTDVYDTILEVEGGQYYRCQSDINYKQELDDVLSAIKVLHRSYTDGNEHLLFTKEKLQLTTVVLSSLLSLVLTGVLVTQCLLQRKDKHKPLKTKGSLDPSSRRPLENEYEHPHLYMDVAV